MQKKKETLPAADRMSRLQQKILGKRLSRGRISTVSTTTTAALEYLTYNNHQVL